MPDPVPDPKQSAEDALVAMINRAAERAAAAAPAAAAVPHKAEEPSPRKTRSPLEEEKFVEEFQAAAASGDGKKMLQMMREGAIDPGLGAVVFLAENQGKANVARLADQFGKKFEKRRELFETTMRRYGRSYADLADPDLADKIWKLTLIDDPTYTQEEVNERLSRAQAERDAEAARVASMPFPTAPITDLIRVDEPHVALAEKYMPKDRESRERIIRKCARYAVPLEAVLRQVAKFDQHPEEIERNEYGEPVWVVIGGSSRQKQGAA